MKKHARVKHLTREHNYGLYPTSIRDN